MLVSQSKSAGKLLCLVAIMATAAQASFIVGGFNAARGGVESLATGEDTALANSIGTAFPGTTFQFTSTLTPAFLSGVNVLILGVATTNFTAITPLTSAEQTAMYNFVLNGGTALIFADNSTFDVNAPAANASLLSPFGVTVSGTINDGPVAPMINSTGPLTGPFKPATQLATNTPGEFTSNGNAMVLAEFNNNPLQAAIDYFPKGALGPGSGAVVLFSDSNAMVSGDALTTANLDIVLNAFDFTTPTASPEPGTLVMLAAGLGILAVAVRRRSKSRLA